ncbi:MAG: Fic family protein [Cyclobacteriaceae bacterium]
MTNITTAVALKKELDTLRPISKANEMRIMQKFRLDWNFHSNNLEGNSLTYGETKALILFGITAQGKPLKDHLEVTGHDEAIKWVEEVLKENRPLTENFIRQLHELILKEDYQTDAITPDGKPTKKWVRIGQYKELPNHVKTATGEIFYFATPEETPAKMHDLLKWYREEKEDTNPILLAAEFHYKFIRIHPFDDGNGRTARILMNFILMQFGYPPVIIKTQDKENYIAALRQADAGIIEPFIEYITDNLIRSLEIMIKGAKGEDIEEPDDLDKELALLKQRLDTPNEQDNRGQAILDFCKYSVAPLFRAFISYGDKLRTFYYKRSYDLLESESDIEHLKSLNVLPMLWENEPTKIDATIEIMLDRISSITSIIEMRINYEESRIREHKRFGFASYIRLTFADTEVIIQGKSNNHLSIPYSQQLTEDVIQTLARSEAKYHKEMIEQKIAELQQAKNEKQ